MLIECWRQTVARRGSAVALQDLATGRSFTFRELDAAARERVPDAGAWVCPRGREVTFLLDVLGAWQAGRILCPLEPGQPVPTFESVPAGTAHLKLTSGSTGAPRCIRFTAAQLAADAEAIVRTMELHEDSPNLGVISLAHSYGFSSLVLPLLLHGIPLILVPSCLPAAVAAAARRFGEPPLTLPAVPTLWAAWQEADAIPSRIHRAISAGAPLPLALEERVFRERGLKIHNFLGASECGGIAYDASATPRTHSSTAGHPLHGVALAVGENGCLEVRGPAVGLGYWPDADAHLRDGVFRSQDLGEIGDSGELRILGRAGDLINVAGRKFLPDVVEQALLRHPAVRAALVLGVPAQDWRGDTVAAVVEARGTITETELRDHLLHAVPTWQVPRVWHFVPELPTTARGKISRADWRRQLGPQ